MPCSTRAGHSPVLRLLSSVPHLSSHIARRSYSTSSSRSSTTSPSPPPVPKKLSPYRLVPAHTFLAAFAPLHAQGWRLNNLTSPLASPGTAAKAVLDESGDLQDYELIRTYGFEMTKEGWKRAAGLVQQIAEVVEQQDHHPKILLCPSSDLPPSLDDSPAGSMTDAGYAVMISTRTHTPLPPPVQSVNSQDSLALPLQPTLATAHESPGGGRGKVRMRPGVTTKDLRLAQAVEELWVKHDQA